MPRKVSEIVAEATTEGDELLVHACDLDATRFGKNTIFDFARHRRIEHYGLITSRVGAVLWVTMAAAALFVVFALGRRFRRRRRVALYHQRPPPPSHNN